MFLSNSLISISISEQGAELTSLRKDGHEYLWTADKRFWARHAPILFPIVGKVFDNCYHVEDRAYPMSQHGFARDSYFEQISDNQLRLVANHTTLEVYPYQFELVVCYKLKGSALTASWLVTNNDDKPMFFQIGAHPGFLYPDFNSSDEVHGYFECYKKGERLTALNCSSLQQGYVVPNDKCLMHLADGRLPITSQLFANDALVLEDAQVDKVVLCDKFANPYLSVSSPQADVMGLWAPKGSETPFCCIEPWCGRADTINFNGDISQRDYIHRLNPSESFHFDYTIELLRS